MLLQEPLKHNPACRSGGGQPAGRGVVGQSVVDTRLEACRKPSFAAPSSSRAAPGVRWAGCQAGWVVEWYGPMLCQVQISHNLANEMRDVATDASTPDQRWAPMTSITPRARSRSEHDSHGHPVDHVHQFLAALGTTCRWGVLETGMRLKLQLLAPSQPETPITTVVDVGRVE